MRRTTATILICSVLALLVILGPVAARAEGEPYPTPDVTAGTMILDVVLVRPVSIIATVFGAATYVVALPFTLPTGSVDEAGRKLVAEPFKYSFKRPLGQLSDRPVESY